MKENNNNSKSLNISNKINKNKLINNFRVIYNNTQNPIELFFYYMNIKKETECKLKYNMGKFNLNRTNKYLLGRNVVALDYLIKNNKKEKLEHFKNLIKSLDDEYADINGVKFYNDQNSGVFWEYFQEYPYLDVDLKNRTVIDIGANIGDSSLLIANEKAEVYAFEPVPMTFELAKKNIELNQNLKNRIHLYNLAIGDEDGTIEIFIESLEKSNTANSFIQTGEKIEVKCYTIETILKKFSITPDILKMDCEGAEYQIIEKSDLSMFNTIILEYHQKFVGISYKVLVEKLEEMGFNVEVLENSEYKKDEIGFIIANKNE